MRMNLLDLDLEDMDDDTIHFEPIRKSSDPVSGKHDFQRRAECGVNRHRKVRTDKQ